MVLSAPPAPPVSRAVAVARSAYEQLAQRIEAFEDERLRRVAAGAHRRGLRALADLDLSADVTLSSEASEALDAYVASLQADDEDAIVMWLGMFPDAVREAV